MKNTIIFTLLFLCLVVSTNAYSQTAVTLYDQAIAETDPQKKITLLTKVIQKDPKFPITYILRGHAYMDLKDYAKADQDFTEFYKKFQAMLTDKPAAFLDMVVGMTSQSSIKSLGKIKPGAISEDNQKSVLLPAYIFAKSRLVIDLQKAGKIPSPYTAK